MSRESSRPWERQPPATPRQPHAGDLLFEFVRAWDRAPVRCELRFHGESNGWEAQFFERGELLCSRGGFALRELAVPGPNKSAGPSNVRRARIAEDPAGSAKRIPINWPTTIRRAAGRPPPVRAVSRRRQTNARACRMDSDR